MINENDKTKKTYTVAQARLKAESYCAYQERAQQEVRDKLYEWGLHQEEIEQIISDLITENFLNEERFAKAYVLGKFRMKGWGKIKIKQHLKFKRVSDPLIKIALREIDLDEYEQKVEQIINKKSPLRSTEISLTEKAKLVRYLQSKGYESDLIFSKLK